jgi:hypothetical protein
MRASLFIAVIAVAAGPVLAGPQLLPVKATKYATYDFATGRIAPAEGPLRYGESVWAATQFSGYFFPSYHYSQTVLDWGDITNGQGIGGFTFCYSTDVMLPDRFDAIIMFFADENGWNSVNRSYLAGFTVTDVPGLVECASTWRITCDLDAAGADFTIAGSDLDGDGLADFGYTYWFENVPPTPGNYTGPLIAGDPNVPPCTCPGAENAYDAFSDPNLQEYEATYWFDGSPFAQFYMELFATSSPNHPCPHPGSSGMYCYADIEHAGGGCEMYPCDCIVGLADLQKLLSNYGMTTGATHAEGDLEPAPPCGDGDVDLGDLAELLTQYGDDCN